MREIKFREYRGDGKWHYWGLMEEGKFIGPCSPNSIAQQFTGLFDSKGKEIYEGDILEFDLSEEAGFNEKGIVMFSKNGFWTSQDENYLQEILAEELEAFPTIIIGNIYDKPVKTISELAQEKDDINKLIG